MLPDEGEKGSAPRGVYAMRQKQNQDRDSDETQTLSEIGVMLMTD